MANGDWRMANGEWRRANGDMLYVRRIMNDENPFRPPSEALVGTSENTPKRSKTVIIGMYVWIVITFAINGPLAGFLLGFVGIPAMDIVVLFGRDLLVVYVIICSLTLFRCRITTYAVTTAILIATLFVRTYIDCVIYGSMDGLFKLWIYFSVVALVTSYLYVAESFLIRRMKSSTRS